MLQKAPHGVADLHTPAEELPIPHVIDEFEGRGVVGYVQSEPTIGTVDHLHGHCRSTSRTSNGREDMRFVPIPAMKRFDEEDENICSLKLRDSLCAVRRSISDGRIVAATAGAAERRGDP
jgi:hypothetical protein